MWMSRLYWQVLNSFCARRLLQLLPRKPLEYTGDNHSDLKIQSARVICDQTRHDRPILEGSQYICVSFSRSFWVKKNEYFDALRLIMTTWLRSMNASQYIWQLSCVWRIAAHYWADDKKRDVAVAVILSITGAAVLAFCCCCLKGLLSVQRSCTRVVSVVMSCNWAECVEHDVLVMPSHARLAESGRFCYFFHFFFSHSIVTEW